MSIYRPDKKRDANEADIVDTLRKAGVHVICADQPWDLVCSFGGHVKLAEVKAPRNLKMEPKGFTDAQTHILETWQGHIDVLVTTKQALAFAERMKAEARLLKAAQAYGVVS